MCLLGKSARLHYAVCERTFDVRTELGVGGWLHLGSAGKRAYLTPPDRDADAGVLELRAWGRGRHPSLLTGALDETRPT